MSWRRLALLAVIASLPACVVDTGFIGTDEERVLDLAQEASASCSNNVYEIGPGKPFENITDAPWDTLQPGDEVKIFWRQAPYREKILISRSGTEPCPILVQGVPNAAGDLPVIQGENALLRLRDRPFSATLWDHAIVLVARRLDDPFDDKPRHIVIENLEVTSALPSHLYIDENGEISPYARGAASIYIMGAEHVTVSGCHLHDSENGLIVRSGASEQELSHDIVIERSHFQANGHIGSATEHNVYAESGSITLQYNQFERLVSGALGSNIKDRSTQTVIRYNWLEGGAHLLDLVEPDVAWETLIGGSSLNDIPTYVYGNVLMAEEQDGAHLIHYGGDLAQDCDSATGNCGRYRMGRLYFYNNTMSIRADASSEYVSIFQVDRTDAWIDIRNNIFFAPDAANLVLLGDQGNAEAGANWISEGFRPSRPDTGDYKFLGTFQGIEGFITGTDPGFVDLGARNLQLDASSRCIDEGGPASPSLDPGHALQDEYVMHQDVQPRWIQSSLDLGAFEALSN